MERPFEGIRVLEFSTMITASYAAMMLAEQGAQVIKVEPVGGGDPMRGLGSLKGGISALFANCNRGKRSLAIDLKHTAGRDAVQRLAADTDVILHNFRPGVMDSLGLGSEALRAANPRLVYVAISGFGTRGPLRDAPAYDPMVQAQVGTTAMQGEFMRTLLCDKITAYTAMQAVATALYCRERSGAGRHIDISMLDASLFFLFPDGFMHRTLLDEDVQHRPPLYEVVYNMIATRDGAISFGAATPAQLGRVAKALDRPELVEESRFSTINSLVAHLGEFMNIVRAAIAELSTEEILSRLRANDVPCAKCLDHEETLAQDQVISNDSAGTLTHPLMGTMRFVRYPVRFDGEALPPGAPAPALGQHNEEILAGLGIGAQQISRMREDGAIA